jgi:hypothetical protein
VGRVRVEERQLTAAPLLLGQAVVHVVRGHQPEADVMVLAVVPVEKVAAAALAVLQGVEACWEV